MKLILKKELITQIKKRFPSLTIKDFPVEKYHSKPGKGDFLIIHLTNNKKEIISIIRHHGSYGNDKGLFETLGNKTNITGYLDLKGVIKIIKKELN